VFVGFCIKCGKEVPEDAYFCPSCGARTLKGREAGVSAPLDEMRDALSTMGKELEKAFQTAAKEIRGTFETARENVKQSIPMKPVICKNCSQKNLGNANFCTKCGKELVKN
jgi:rRNA maturation endonuclease Nob1